jgi:hypothetical protein
VNLRSGLQAVGALRPSEGNSQEPVALETTVIATGARPGDTTKKRELFTEETQTVLVFERGAVIRLSAAVVDGQLLFLTNKATGKEVVTQVLRKRAFRPTACYVDLEFTEACPGFWNIDFPKSGAAPDAASVAKKLAADEDSENTPVKPAIAPSVQEVERLKQEVAQLQTQLKSLTQPEADSATAAAPVAVKAATEIRSELAKNEEEKRLEELFATETRQELANLPSKRLVAYPRKSGKSTLKSRTKKGAIAACILLFVVAGGVSAYQYRVFFYVPKKTTAAKPAEQPRPPVSTAQPNDVVAAVVLNTAQPKTFNSSQTNAVVTNSAKSDDGGVPANSVPAARGAELIRAEPNPRIASNSGSNRGKNHAAPDARSRREIVPSSAAPVASGNSGAHSSDAIANVPASPTLSDYIAPKLVKGSKSVAPPEAIRNYVAGDVVMDALVDTMGHVQTVKVLSGPAKLHAPATEVMKQYVYEPAKKNGKAVPAHVQVSLQFWYAP